MRRWEKILLGLLLLVALLLRSAGLSHDLHEGRRYHPDSPKQVRAVQQFLGGQYYKHFGLMDYDGYPLFHARIAELIIRVVEPVRAGFLTVLGIPSGGDLLASEAAIYWQFLGMNVLFSTAIVLIVFRAGRESIGPPAGWIAALLMTISPADVTCAHLATGDATTAFFAALALFHCLRVYRLGRMRDYAWATLAATFAFAAKYYAATAFFALALAHIMRVGVTRPDKWFDVAALRRIGVCVIVAVAALLFAIPALIENFSGSIADIHNALVNSTQRYPPDIAVASKWVKYKFSMRVNVPDLIRSISPVALIAILLAPLWRMREPRIWILLVGPALYVFLAVGSRGLVNPIYHTAITPPLFLLVALCCVWAAENRGRFRLLARCAAAATVSGATSLFALDTAREVFFALHMDTRRLSEEWVRENIPATFSARNGRYTFLWFGGDHIVSRPAGVFSVRSANDPGLPETEAPHLRTYNLENDPLTQFRNMWQRIGAGSPGLLNDFHASLPGARWPSETGNEFIPDDGVEFIRSEKVWIVDRADRVKRWIVAQKPLTETWIGVQSVSPNAAVYVDFGDRRRKIRVGEGANIVVPVSNPDPSFPTGDGLYFYPIEIEAANALVKVTLATSPTEARRMLLAMGRNDETAKLSGVTALPVSPQTPLEFFATYGVHPDYLDAIPFLHIDGDKLSVSGFRIGPVPTVGTDGEGPYEQRATTNRKAKRESFFGVWTRPLLLDTAAYRGTFFARSLAGNSSVITARLIIRNVHGEQLYEKPLTIPALDTRPYSKVPFTFSVPRNVAGCSVMLQFDSLPALAFGGLDIHPDYFPAADAAAP